MGMTLRQVLRTHKSKSAVAAAPARARMDPAGPAEPQPQRSLSPPIFCVRGGGSRRVAVAALDGPLTATLRATMR
jgi:hypothetical protein